LAGRERDLTNEAKTRMKQQTADPVVFSSSPTPNGLPRASEHPTA